MCYILASVTESNHDWSIYHSSLFINSGLCNEGCVLLFECSFGLVRLVYNSIRCLSSAGHQVESLQSSICLQSDWFASGNWTWACWSELCNQFPKCGQWLPRTWTCFVGNYPMSTAQPCSLGCDCPHFGKPTVVPVGIRGTHWLGLTYPTTYMDHVTCVLGSCLCISGWNNAHMYTMFQPAHPLCTYTSPCTCICQ